MNILFDDDSRLSLLPLTHTRPVGEIRIGILKIREKWERFFGTEFTYLTESYLKNKFPYKPGKDNLFINGSIQLPAALQLQRAILLLQLRLTVLQPILYSQR